MPACTGLTAGVRANSAARVLLSKDNYAGGGDRGSPSLAASATNLSTTRRSALSNIPRRIPRSSSARLRIRAIFLSSVMAGITPLLPLTIYTDGHAADGQN